MGTSTTTTDETGIRETLAHASTNAVGCIDFSCLTPPPRDLQRHRIALLADDLGRMRRFLDLEPGGYGEHLLDRVAGHVESLHLLAEPTAADLTARTYPGDDETAAAAIDTVDASWQRLQARLRPRKAA